VVTKQGLQWHMTTHNVELPFVHVCSLCGKEFRLRHFLVRHTRQVHTGENRYLCDVCGSIFFKKSSLERHMLTHAKDYEVRRPYACYDCGKQCVSYYKLKIHMHRHTDEHFACPVCDKRFVRAHPFRQHLRRHEEQLLVDVSDVTSSVSNEVSNLVQPRTP